MSISPLGESEQGRVEGEFRCFTLRNITVTPIHPKVPAGALAVKAKIKLVAEGAVAI